MKLNFLPAVEGSEQRLREVYQMLGEAYQDVKIELESGQPSSAHRRSRKEARLERDLFPAKRRKILWTEKTT